MNSKVMQRLLWKDARTIASFAIAMFVIAVVLSFLQRFVADTMEIRYDDRWWVAYGIWILLPNLLALGIPALLVGGEEESGSLAWLRTLPAQWNAIIGSKLVVASVVVATVFVTGTIAFLIELNGYPEYAHTLMQRAGIDTDHFGLHIFGQVVFCVVLLLVSFITAYLFRSPVSALVAVVPVMGGFAFAFFAIDDYLSTNGFGQTPWREVYRGHPWLLILAVVGIVAVLFLIHQWAARRRLVVPQSSLKEHLSDSAAVEAFRPPTTPMSWYGVSLIQRAPDRTVALLWQFFRQVRWVLGVAIAMTLFGLLMTWSGQRSVEPFGGLLVMVGLLLIGGATFYGDSVRRRCVFLYDRGISPTFIWVTRVGPTLLVVVTVTLVCLAAMVMGRNWQWSEVATIAGVILGFYSLCQLVSIWSPRPILVFFATPALVAVCVLCLSPLFGYYDRAAGVLLVCALLLLFASWRMVPRWMTGRNDRSFSYSFAGYFAVGLILPYVLVIGARWATMPTERTQWRKQMMAMDLSGGLDDREPFRITSPSVEFSVAELTKMTSNLYEESGEADLETRLRLEVQNKEGVGKYVPIDELLKLAAVPDAMTLVLAEPSESGEMTGFQEQIFEPTKQQLVQRAKVDLLIAKVLAKWSTIDREQALAGIADVSQIHRAEVVDNALATLLEFYVDQETLADGFGEIASILPTASMTRQSRVAGVVNSWRRMKTSYGNDLFGLKLPQERWLAVERIRAERYSDELAYLMVQEFSSGGNFTGVTAQSQLRSLLVELELATSPSNRRGNRIVSPTFVSELTNVNIGMDQRFSRIRSQLRSRGGE